MDGSFVIAGNLFLHEGDSFKILRDFKETGNCVAVGNSSNLITKIKYSGKPQEGDRVYLTSSAAMNFRIAHTEKEYRYKRSFPQKSVKNLF